MVVSLEIVEQCIAVNLIGMIGIIYYQPHPTLTPTKDEVSYENAIDVSDKVWIMVR